MIIKIRTAPPTVSFTDIIDIVKKHTGENVMLRLIPDYYGSYWLHVFIEGVNSTRPLKTTITTPDVAMAFLEVLYGHLFPSVTVKAIVSDKLTGIVTLEEEPSAQNKK